MAALAENRQQCQQAVPGEVREETQVTSFLSNLPVASAQWIPLLIYGDLYI